MSSQVNQFDLVNKIAEVFSDPALFDAQFVNDRKYLSMYRCHSRVCGLLAKVGHELGYVVDIGRRHPISPLVGRSGRKQLQAEADITFVDPHADINSPVVLLDYESSDAPVAKMRTKFNYLSTFAQFSSTVQLVGLFITITGVKGFDTREPTETRRQFAEHEVLELIYDLQQCSYNEPLLFLLGTFLPNYLQLRLFKACQEVKSHRVDYAISIASLAKDLVGCLEGPIDLATNPKYMEGFGR